MKQAVITKKPTIDTNAALKFAAVQPYSNSRQMSQGTSGLVPAGDVRLTANIRQDLHLKLKLRAVNERTTIGELIEQLIEKHL